MKLSISTISQTQLQLQGAAAEIMRAAKVDGPDRFWPELEPELKLFAALGDNGQLGLQFENPAGTKAMNAMVPSDVCPGAMVYHGTKEGIHKAFLTASFLSDTQSVFINAVNVSQRFEAVSRTANLRLRVADLHEHVQPRDSSSAAPLESSAHLPSFFCPSERKLSLPPVDIRWKRKHLSWRRRMEEQTNGAVNLDTSKPLR
ncbi:uncharacterized protein FPRN_11114 [Fusarium proliferatum]|nr:uncharacterized protein FPRN_11114 [Fusarium proliferatum]